MISIVTYSDRSLSPIDAANEFSRDETCFMCSLASHGSMYRVFVKESETNGLGCWLMLEEGVEVVELTC